MGGGTWEEGLTALPNACRVSSYPGTQHGRKGPRLGHPVSTDLPSASAGASGELPHTRSWASPAQQGPAWPTGALAKALPRVSPWPKFSPWHGAGSSLRARVMLPGSARAEGGNTRAGGLQGRTATLPLPSWMVRGRAGAVQGRSSRRCVTSPGGPPCPGLFLCRAGEPRCIPAREQAGAKPGTFAPSHGTRSSSLS